MGARDLLRNANRIDIDVINVILINVRIVWRELKYNLKRNQMALDVKIAIYWKNKRIMEVGDVMGVKGVQQNAEKLDSDVIDAIMINVRIVLKGSNLKKKNLKDLNAIDLIY